MYNAFLGAATPKQIARVPFEVWNVGTTPDDPSDDVRMIPVLRQNRAANPLVVDWDDTFVGTERRIVGNDTLDIPITEQPGRPLSRPANGYALFEAAAIGFGGAGAIYDPGGRWRHADRPEPDHGHGVQPAGLLRRLLLPKRPVRPPGWQPVFSAAFVQLLFTDLAGDGTTPPAGTVVRLKMARYPLVANEPPAPAGADRVAIEAVWPNPLRAPRRCATRSPWPARRGWPCTTSSAAR